MKFENGHHVKTEDLTEELYHKFCQKVKGQGFDDGEYPYSGWMHYNYVGISNERIYHSDGVDFNNPELLLTIEQALSDRQEQPMSKVRIIEIEQEPKFKPFKLEITIGSEKELINLWHRMNISVNYFMDNGYYPEQIKCSPDYDSQFISEIWQELEVKAKEFGLRE